MSFKIKAKTSIPRQLITRNNSKVCRGCGHEKIYSSESNFEIDVYKGYHTYCRRCVNCGKRALTRNRGIYEEGIYCLDPDTSKHFCCGLGDREITNEEINKLCYIMVNGVKKKLYKESKEAIVKIWCRYIIDQEFSSYIQWPPEEVIDDILILL